jgi:hypothetical protein
VEKRVSRLAQLRSCLVEILVLVNEVCAASPSNAIIGFYEARHLIHENAPECVGRDGANQQFERTRLAATKKADGISRLPSATGCRTAVTRMKDGTRCMKLNQEVTQ